MAPFFGWTRHFSLHSSIAAPVAVLWFAAAYQELGLASGQLIEFIESCLKLGARAIIVGAFGFANQQELGDLLGVSVGIDGKCGDRFQLFVGPLNT
ncbi:MAG TPA: hypothetical protein VHK03_07920, partial [Aestuariivirgaceae bacterium]|nr:hypothetical protein [Aestuariivirgaceae bacterium]